jgi:hypothetical protein
MYLLQMKVSAAKLRIAKMSGSNSAVECQLPKLDVAGSIPVSRSNLLNNSLTKKDLSFLLSSII